MAETTSPRAKWAWYRYYWLVAAPVGYLALPILIGVEPAKWAKWWTDAEYAAPMVAILAALAGLQALILRPMGSPWPTRAAGASLAASLVAGAFLVSLLVASAVAVLVSAAWLLGGENYLQHDAHGWFWGAMLGAVVLAWATATPLLLAYARRHAGEDVLARIAAMLFRGTAVEALALIPVDVMVRMRSKCYCGEGSFIALLLWLAVGLVVMGPALLYVLWRRPSRSTRGERSAVRPE